MPGNLSDQTTRGHRTASQGQLVCVCDDRRRSRWVSKWTVRCSNNPPWTPTANFLVLSLRYIVSSLVFHGIQLRQGRFAPGSKTDGQTLASRKNNSYQVVVRWYLQNPNPIYL